MRGKQAKKREVAPDQIYGSLVITKLIHRVMQHGKKTVAAEVVYDAIQRLSDAVKEEPMRAFDKALGNVKPTIEVRSRRVGGANYQVPVPVEEGRQIFLAMKWLVEGARNKKGSSMADRLSGELISAYKGEGDAFKKKTDVERMAEANKAFAHFRW